MRQEKDPLAPTEIDSNSKYESEGRTSTGSTLLLYTSPQPTPPLPSLSLSPLSPPLYTMSQHGLHAIIRQQQEQLMAMQERIRGG